MQGLVKAFRLEIKHIKESKAHLLLLFLIPTLVVIALAIAGKFPYPWYPFKEDFSFYDVLAPQIFSILVLFITIQLTVLRIVGERAPYGTLDRDLLAISRTGMFMGKFSANIVIAFSQCFLIFLVGKGIYNVKILGESYLVFILLCITALVGLAMGMFFSVISKTKEQAVQLVPFSILILFVLNGSVIPLDAMPSSLGQIANNLPLTLSYKSLEDAMLFGKFFQDVFDEIIKLSIWVIGLLMLGIIKFTTEKK